MKLSEATLRWEQWRRRRWLRRRIAAWAGTALAAGLLVAAGALHGFLAPIIRVQAETMFGNNSAGLLTLACVAIVGVVIIFSLRVNRTVPQAGSVQH